MLEPPDKTSARWPPLIDLSWRYMEQKNCPVELSWIPDVQSHETECCLNLLSSGAIYYITIGKWTSELPMCAEPRSASFPSLSSTLQNQHRDLSSHLSLFGLNIRGHAEVIDIRHSILQDSPNVFLDCNLLLMTSCWILQADRAGRVGSVPESQLNGLFSCF